MHQTIASSWASWIDGDYYEQVVGVAFDGNNNFVVVGSSNSPIFNIYDNDENLVQSFNGSASYSSFVIRYNKNGTILWASIIDGDADDYAKRVAIDKNGNIAVVGHFSSHILQIIDSNNVLAASLNSSGTMSAFIINYDQSGSLIWTSRLDGNNIDQALDVAFDSDNNVIVTGYYKSPILYIYDSNQNQIANLSNTAGSGSFVVKYSSDGSLLWMAKQEGNNLNVVQGLSVDNNDSIAVVGYFNSLQLAIFDSNNSQTQLLNNISGIAVYAVKYSSDGNVLWSTKMDGTGADLSSSVAFDSQRNIYIVGYYNSPVLFIYDQSDSQNFSLNNSGGQSSFLVKYSSNGNFIWASRMDGASDDFILDVSVSNNDDIAIAGYYSQPSLVVYDSSGQEIGIFNQTSIYSAFIVRFNSNGNVNWAAQADGPSIDQFAGIDFDKNGNLMAVGSYYSEALNVTDLNDVNSMYAISSTTSSLSTQTQSITQTYSTARQYSTTSQNQTIMYSETQGNPNSQTQLPMSSTTLLHTTQDINLITQSGNVTSTSYQFNFTTDYVKESTSAKDIDKIDADKNQQQTSSALQDFWNSNYIFILIGASIIILIVITIIALLFYRRRKIFQHYSPQLSSIVGVYQEINDSNMSTFNFDGTTAVMTSGPLSIPAFLQFKFGFDFRTDSLIAQGGNSKIYNGKILNHILLQSTQGCTVIVKVLDESQTLQFAQIDAFRHELSMYYKFQSYKTFPKIFAYSENPYALVMKYYSIGSLKDLIYGRIESAPFTPLICVDILKQFSQGIQKLHESGFVHLDIKPDNVMLDLEDDGHFVPVITDFGISKLFDQSKNLVSTFKLNQLRGMTLNFAAPEMILNFRQGTILDQPGIILKCDIYSISIMMYEMITRKNAWSKYN